MNFLYIYNLIDGLIVLKLYVIKAKSKMILQFLAHLKAMSIPPFSKGGSIISIKTKKKSEKHKESITWEQYCNGHPDPSHLIQRESVKINNFSDGQKAVIFNTLRSAWYDLVLPWSQSENFKNSNNTAENISKN